MLVACLFGGKDYDYSGAQMKNRKKIDRVLIKFKNPCYLRVIRDNTECIARNMGFAEDQVYELSLAVDEAYVNAIEHSGRVGGLSELEIEYLIHSDRLEVSVKDSGCGFDLARLQIPKNLRSLESTRGRGLGLIQMLSDRFEFNSIPGCGTMVRIIKYMVSRHKNRIVEA